MKYSSNSKIREANFVLISSKKKNNFHLCLLNTHLAQLKLDISTSLIDLNKEFSLSIDINSVAKFNVTAFKSVFFLPPFDLFSNLQSIELIIYKTIR